MSEFVIDCETLSSKWNAVILSCAIVCLDLENDANATKSDKALIGSMDKYYTKIERESQIQKGRDVSQDTLDWWKKQSNGGVLEVLTPKNCISVEQFFTELKAFLVKHKFNPKEDTIFTRRFIDSYWINSLYDDFTGKGQILPFWCFRETVTALQCLTGEVDGMPLSEETLGMLPKHNALSDCYLDGLRITHAFCPPDEGEPF